MQISNFGINAACRKNTLEGMQKSKRAAINDIRVADGRPLWDYAGMLE